MNQLLSCALLIYWSWEKVIDVYSLGWVGVSSVLWTVLGVSPSRTQYPLVAVVPADRFGFLAADLVVHLFPSIFTDGFPNQIVLFFPVVVAVIASAGRFALHLCSSDFYFLVAYCSGYGAFLLAWDVCNF